MKNNLPLAPVILFVYNRPWHVRQTLEALSKNELAAQSDLYIYADGVKKGASHAQVNRIAEVRKVIREKQWCKNIFIVEAENNKGLADSVISGVSDILNISEKVIVLEDDVITSPFFLQFMNDSLTVFQNEEKVLSISSWNYFTGIKKVPDNFFMQMPDTIAWGTWRRAWKLFQYNAASLHEQLKKHRLMGKFNLDNRYDFEKMLVAQVNAQVSSWGIRWTASAVLNNTLSFYPKISLTKHIGFGEDSTNCMTNDYNKDLQLAAFPIKVGLIPLKESSDAVNAWLLFEKKVKRSPDILEKRYRVKTFILYTLRNLKFRSAGIIKRVLKRLLKPYLNSQKPQAENANLWNGDYASWGEAGQNCAGYDAVNILEKVKDSILKVKNGEAVYERDSVLFDKMEYSKELVAAFTSIALEKENKLDVVDFGGSLGSSYFQMHTLLNETIDLNWNVVEQKHFVSCGKEFIQDDNLKFHNTIEEALQHSQSHILLVSSVVQYLEKPYDFIEKAINYGFDYILIDRTAFIDADKERITVQVVPESIYKASYPVWFLNEKKFINSFLSRYTLIQEFDSYCDPGEYLGDKWTYRKGMVFKRK